MAFSLFGIGKNNSDNTKNKVVEVKIDQIIPNRYQPRKVFDQDGIRELAQTMTNTGCYNQLFYVNTNQQNMRLLLGNVDTGR